MGGVVLPANQMSHAECQWCVLPPSSERASHESSSVAAPAIAQATAGAQMHADGIAQAIRQAEVAREIAQAICEAEVAHEIAPQSMRLKKSLKRGVPLGQWLSAR